MQSTSTPQLRLRSLDGLRGLAAAVVLLHHLSMTIPAVSSGYDSAKHLGPFSPAWWAVASPLKIFVAGPEFVLVFFVLSGFVLTLSPLAKYSADKRMQHVATAQPKPDTTATKPDLKPGSTPRPRYDWLAYYPRRVIRLGIPVVASMILAFGVITVLPHPVSGGDSGWAARQAHPDLSVHNLITETLLVADPSRPSVNPPLWSLTWELWFSLLLPVAVFIALFSRRFPALWAAFFCAVSVWGYIEHVDAATFLPAFALGALLGANAGRIHKAMERWRDSRFFNPAWTAIAIAGPMLSISYWMLRPVVHGHLTDLAYSMRVPGAMLMVATVAFWPAASRVFDARPLAWLGRISFSLYLVHSPIVVGFALLFNQWPWWVGAVASVAVSVALALLMYRFVEKPSQRLASWIGHRVSHAATRRATLVTTAAAAARNRSGHDKPGSVRRTRQDSQIGPVYRQKSGLP